MCDENLFECMCCLEEFSINDRKRCQICEAPVCEDCTKERNINNRCNVCRKVGCLYCINSCPICVEKVFLCYECAYLPGCRDNFVEQMCKQHHDENCKSCN